MKNCSVLALLMCMIPVAVPTAIADPQKQSQEELDQQCEVAREKKLAPLRDAEIAKCKADKRNDPAYCERYFKTYGDATYASGIYVPRMFNDLPECVIAEEERKRRVRLGE